jgi:hypothetical protein
VGGVFEEQVDVVILAIHLDQDGTELVCDGSEGVLRRRPPRTRGARAR